MTYQIREDNILLISRRHYECVVEKRIYKNDTIADSFESDEKYIARDHGIIVDINHDFEKWDIIRLIFENKDDILQFILVYC